MAAAVARPLDMPDSRSATPVQQDRPQVYPVADVAPNKGDFFDPVAPGAEDVLKSPSTSVSQIFAVMRQWVPHTQKNMSMLIHELLRRGCHVEDRDGLTDHTLLHFACKSASAGCGNAKSGAELVKMLISQGADVNAVCRWTGMVAIHYAAYFDAPGVVDVIMQTKQCNVDVTCRGEYFEKGTALHIAVANLASDTVERLLQHGSNPWLLNSNGCSALDSVPAEDSEVASVMRCTGQHGVAAAIRGLLQAAMERTPKPDNLSAVPATTPSAKREVKVGDRVLVNGRRYGIARYIGRVRFTTGSLGCSRYPTTPANHVWVGVELEQATGENNGTVDGKEYFSCPPRKGTFAPVENVAVSKQSGRGKDGLSHSGSSSSSLRPARRISSDSTASTARSPSTPARNAQQQRRVSTDAHEVRSLALSGSARPDGAQRKKSINTDFKIGDQVLVGGKKNGTVRFIGETSFADGVWYGVELETADGKHDGECAGVRYFKCRAKHGIFVPLNKLSRRPGVGSLHTTPSAPRHRSTVGSRGGTPSSAASTPTPSHSVDTPDPLDFMNCKVLVNGEMATVKFIGEVEFAEGTWLGVEMKNTTGKHDGSVKGKRYFTCKPDHGLMVKPQRATFRGISCATILSRQS